MSKNDMVMVPRELADRISKICMFTMFKEDFRALSEILGKPAEQHQGEPVAWQDPDNDSRMCTAEHKAYALSKGGAPAAALSTLTRPLYTHADPSEVERHIERRMEMAGEKTELYREVERLREQCERRRVRGLACANKVATLRAKLATVKADRDAHAQNAIDLREELAREKKAHMRVYDVHQHLSEVYHSLRAQLAERDALLARVAYWLKRKQQRPSPNDLWGQKIHDKASKKIEAELARDIDSALPASAEPSAPKCKHCLDQGEIHTGKMIDQGYWQPPEPDMEPCPHCQDEPSAPVERHEPKECPQGYGHGGQWCGPDYKCWLDPRSREEKARAALERKP
jgi:hypothetical protein